MNRNRWPTSIGITGRLPPERVADFTGIRRQSVIVAYERDSIVAACRYYRRKNGDISLYQFAIREDYRGRQLLIHMLKTLGNVCVHSKCPAKIEFNNYYKKTGWHLKKNDGEYCHWIISFGSRL